MVSEKVLNVLIYIFEFTIAGLQVSISLCGKNQLEVHVNAFRNKYLD